MQYTNSCAKGLMFARFAIAQTIYSLVFCAAVLLLGCCQLAWAETPEVVPGQFLIKFNSSKLQQLALTADAIQSSIGVQTIADNPLSGTQLVAVAPGNVLNTAAIKNLLASGLIRYFEPNYRVHTLDTQPNDPRFSELWGLHNSGHPSGTEDVDLDAPSAWDLTTGSDSIVVGIVDTGINYNHPDLAENVWTNPGEIAGNGIDDDANGVVDDVHGFNAISGSGNPLDDHGHGSHCAGTIGARGNNGIGVAGINWHVKLLGLKFLDSSGYGSMQAAIAAIEYAIRLKHSGVNLRVLSNSWGGGGFSQALMDAIRLAESEGILFVAAAGNDGRDTDIEPTYPADYDVDNVVSVAAADNNGNLASFSNFGTYSVDLAAPGVGILSTSLGSSYAVLSGTSMATPHVSGVAALVLSREPNLGVQELKDRLLSTVKLRSSLTDQMRSPGIVNALWSLTNARSPVPPLPKRAKYAATKKTLHYDTNIGVRVLNQDDGYYDLPLPFTLPYYDGQFSRVAISANGRIVPLAADEQVPNTPDYSNGLYQGISVYNDDLYPSTVSPQEGGVWVAQDASSVTITWISVPYGLRGSANSAVEQRVQVKLNANGSIQLNYLDTEVADATFNYGASATISALPVSDTHGESLVISSNAANQAMLHGTSLELRLQNQKVIKDYDGDGKSDIMVYRQPSGMWFILTSSSGFAFAEHRSHQLGLPGDVPITGDYDGDGRVDLAVFRPSDGNWFIRYSAGEYAEIANIQWGLPGDSPQIGDYDGDGRSDLSVYRPSTGMFYVLYSAGGFDRGGALSGRAQASVAVALGGPGHDVVIGDFTGDGRADFGVVWQPYRFWTVRDTQGAFVFSLPWGQPGDTPLACDTDGDLHDDRFVVRWNDSGSLQWFGALAATGVDVFELGRWGDLPSCAEDFDGDGKTDSRVFHPQDGTWRYRISSTGEEIVRQFGLAGDTIPQ